MYNGLNHLYEKSCDNSHENTTKSLPPTMQFKAHGSNMSAQVGKCSHHDWSSLSPDRSCLCMPTRHSAANSRRAVSMWAGGKSMRGLHRVWAGRMWGGNRVDVLCMERDWCHDHSALRCLPYLKGVDVAFDAAGDACEKNRNDVWVA